MLGFGKCTRSLTSLGSIGSLGYVLGFKEFLGYDFLCKNIRNFFWPIFLILRLSLKSAPGWCSFH